MNSLRKRAKPAHEHGHGMKKDDRGQDQPTDKARAQQASNREPNTGEKAQRDAAVAQPQSPGQPAGGE
jgi:hypothetical protein